MSARMMEDGVYYVGSQDWDRQIFDELIPLPQGTSYNSYLIQGRDKTALIDTVDPEKAHELLKNLQELELKIDYIVSNHAEQDHSGSIPLILEEYPEAVVITNPKCKELLKNFLFIPEDKFKTIGDGDKISLGGKTLEFIFTPWVHWPDTMVTYLEENRMLFSCDFFGSHMATSQLYSHENEEVYSAAKRYYAELMMPFRPTIKNNLAKISKRDIKTIAPSHGPIYSPANEIINLYKDWISDETLNLVVIPYVSMHGSTRVMVDHLVDSLIKRGLVVKPFNLGHMDPGEFLMSLVDASTLVIASPTVLTGPHPLTVSNAYLINLLRPKLKYVAIMGSFGWGSRMEELLKGQLSNLKVEYLESISIKGLPTQDDLEKIDALADEILKKHESS